MIKVNESDNLDYLIGKKFKYNDEIYIINEIDSSNYNVAKNHIIYRTNN